MKRLTGIFVCGLAAMMWICPAGVKGGTPEYPENGDCFDVFENTGDEVFTVSDLYTYTGPYCTGTKTAVMAKGDPTDDVNIAPGGSKVFWLGQAQSVTYSYMMNGKEVEFDENINRDLSDQTCAAFDSDSPGLFAIDFGASGGQPLPPIGLPQIILGGAGHMEGGIYDWITFYDVTASGGMIERDPLGHPLSPVLPDGTQVWMVCPFREKFFKVAGYETLTADLNDDKIVDLIDLAIMAEQWLEEEIVP